MRRQPIALLTMMAEETVAVDTGLTTMAAWGNAGACHGPD